MAIHPARKAPSSAQSTSKGVILVLPPSRDDVAREESVGTGVGVGAGFGAATGDAVMARGGVVEGVMVGSAWITDSDVGRKASVDLGVAVADDGSRKDSFAAAMFWIRSRRSSSGASASPCLSVGDCANWRVPRSDLANRDLAPFDQTWKLMYPNPTSKERREQAIRQWVPVLVFHCGRRSHPELARSCYPV